MKTGKMVRRSFNVLAATCAVVVPGSFSLFRQLMYRALTGTFNHMSQHKEPSGNPRRKRVTLRRQREAACRRRAFALACQVRISKMCRGAVTVVAVR